MKKIENLKDLFIEQGRELHHSFQQELAELPKLNSIASSSNLKRIIDKNIETTKKQQKRLSEAFQYFGESPEGSKDSITRSIIRKTNRRIQKTDNPEVCDACIVNSLQQIGHRKIADLGALSGYARNLGSEKVAAIIHDSFDEEKINGKKLIDLARSEINKNVVSEMSS